jgi:hypothetical protein
MPRPLPLLLAAVLAACAGAPRPVMPPPGRIGALAFAGSPLQPAQPLAPTDDAPATAVQCTLRYLDERALPALAPLAARARLIAAVGDERPIQSSLATIAGAGIARADGVATLLGVIGDGGTALGTLEGAVPAGSTLAFAANGADGSELAFQVFDDGADQDLGLAVLAREPRGPARIVVLEDRLARSGEPLALAVPGETGCAWIAVLRAAGPAAPETAERMHAIARATAARANERRAPAGVGAQVEALADARAALDDPTRRRAALLAIAGDSGARLVEDLALALDDTRLAALASALPAGPLPTRDLATVRWWLLRGALAHLATAADRSELAPAANAILLRHVGEVGRSPHLLRETLESADADAFEARLRAENRAFLADGDPAARLRASDWLRARSELPQGYDPLADAAERRQALEAATTSEGGR